MRRTVCLAGLVGIIALLLTGPAQAQCGYGGYGGYGGYRGYRGYGGYGGYGYYSDYSGGGYTSNGYRSLSPYAGAYYAGSVDSAPNVTNVISNYGPTQSSSEESESRAQQALLKVRLPRPDARVLIDGQPTEQTGTERAFVSPRLEQGKNYTYTVKATWDDGGREMSREKTVQFRAGQDVGVDFTRTAANDERVPAPRPLGATRPENGRAEESAFPDKKENSHEGKVVKAGDGKLTMTGKDGSKQHTHDVPATAAITRDGKTSKLDDLKEGDMVTVTMSKDDKGKDLVTKIEAHSK
jgi:uncharacterized protein (TIGR03000 family)